MVRSLTTPYIHRRLQQEAELNGISYTYTCTHKYNKYLQKLKDFYNENQTFIDSSMNKIAKTLQYTNLQQDLQELLNTLPTPIEIEVFY